MGINWKHGNKLETGAKRGIKKEGSRQLRKGIACGFALLLCSGCLASLSKTAPDIVYWTSPQGLKRLSDSRSRADFPRLANEFQSQTDGLVCGPSSGAIVLNALRLRQKKGLPKADFKDLYRKYLPKLYDPRAQRYTPDNFMSAKALEVKSWAELYGKPVKGKKDFGLQLRQLHRIFILHKVRSQIRVVDENLSDERVKAELIANLKREGDYAVVNYKRSALGQKGGGHISPLGAYDEKTDSFLIMDVNSGKYPWAWVKAGRLIGAMRTFDTAENRGYLLISERPSDKKKSP